MKILILGANSDIARAIALEFAKIPGTALHLVSRNIDELERTAKDIMHRCGVPVIAGRLDVVDWGSHADFIDRLPIVPDVAVLAFGYLGDQNVAQANFEEARRIVDTNYVAAVSLGERLAARMEERGNGCIVGIASVAGLRGRQSNYIYGSAKAGMIAWLSGLRNRLAAKGVHVTTVLPGFVATKMTAGLDLPPALTATPEAVAKTIARAVHKRQDVVYVKAVWRMIMLAIRLIPERIFKRLSL